MPAVSVIMVFHRDTPFLRPAIASVLQQTWSDLELVLVDNGTGLGATQLGHLGRDPRIRWVRLSENAGIPTGHNAGVASATGEFIALLDYDDLALPERLERQVVALRSDPGLGLVSARAEKIDERGRRLGEVFCLPNPTEHASYAPYGAPLVTPALMGRRAVFAGLPYRHEFPFAADLDFQARATEHWRMEVLPTVLLHYRWHAQQTTQQRNSAIEQSRCCIQIAAGRRRASRIEDLTEIIQVTHAASAAETWRHGARQCIQDGFAVFAAFQARRALAWDRTAGGAWRASRLAWSAARRVRARERGEVWRMFFTGPVRALGLRPAGKNKTGPTGA